MQIAVNKIPFIYLSVFVIRRCFEYIKLNTNILIIGLILQISFFMTRTSLCGLTIEDISDLAGKGRINIAHSISISDSVYKKKINDIYQFPRIPKILKEKLSEIAFAGIFDPVASEESSDGTVKYLFRNEDGLEYETVYLPEKKRITVCVSTQSGCRMGCHFCLTGRYGFHGNLEARDIVNQVISLPGAERITHVVFMGMGEPIDNLENVLKACRIITSEWGLAISPRNVTVSTVGITNGVIRFLDESNCNLTLSLHSPFAEERKRIIPAENRHPFRAIIEIMKNSPVIKKRRMSIAYVMISGVNDSESHLEELKSMLTGTRIRINLLPYHPLPGDVNISSPAEKMHYYKHELIMSGISASVRKSRGVDISAACGLLASGLK